MCILAARSGSQNNNSANNNQGFVEPYPAPVPSAAVHVPTNNPVYGYSK